MKIYNIQQFFFTEIMKQGWLYSVTVEALLNYMTDNKNDNIHKNEDPEIR